jgi:hypothetical protein
MIWICGVAGILAIIAILQMDKMLEDGEVAPRPIWKWFAIGAVCWPLFVLFFVLASFLVLVLPEPKAVPQRAMLPTMKSKTFAFTVKIGEESWDCYHFESSDGKTGTLGFTRRGVNWIIGLMCAGHLTAEEAEKKLIESNRNEVN